MKITVMDCLDWDTSSKPRQLAVYAHTLMDADFGVEALWTYPTNGKGNKIAALVKRPAKLAGLLHTMGVEAHRSKCLYVTGKESASAVPGILEKLAGAGIPVRYSDILGTGREISATIWVKEKDLASAKKALHGLPHRG